MKEPALLRSSILVLVAFSAGLFSHILYRRWNAQEASLRQPTIEQKGLQPAAAGELASFGVTFVPLRAAPEPAAELPVLRAVDLEKIRGRAGHTARIRGRIFRVGHSIKSNTYFLNFGPSREALTAVIFASAVDSFERNKLPPRIFNGKEVEVTGRVRDHPQYGLGIILEDPGQIKIVN